LEVGCEARRVLLEDQLQRAAPGERAAALGGEGEALLAHLRVLDTYREAPVPRPQLEERSRQLVRVLQDLAGRSDLALAALLHQAERGRQVADQELHAADGMGRARAHADVHAAAPRRAQVQGGLALTAH